MHWITVPIGILKIKKMHRKIQAKFVGLSAIALFVATTFVLLTTVTSSKVGILEQSLPLLMISGRTLFYLAAGFGLAWSALLLWGRPSRLKLMLIGAIAVVCLTYQIGAAYFARTNLFVCLGNLTGWVAATPRVLNGTVFVVLSCLFLGSVALLYLGRSPHGKGIDFTVSTAEVSSIKRLLVGWVVGAMLVLVLLVAMQVHDLFVSPPHLDALVEQSFYRSGVHGEIVEEPSGNGLFYLRDEDDDLNVFQVDQSGGGRERLAELNDVVGSRFFEWIGLSPDGHLMAYSTRDEKKEQQLVLRDGFTGEFHGSFEISPCGVVKEGVWLNTNSLVLLNVTEGLWLFNLETATNLGQLGKRGLVRLRFPSGHKHRWLTPDSEHSVAFVWKNDVWRLDIPNNRLEPLTHFTNGSASELCFDARTGTYLFSANIGGNTRDWHLYSYRPASGWNAAISRLLATPASNAKWAQGTNAVACTLNADNTNYFAVIDFTSGFQTNLFPAKCVNDFSISPDGNRVYAVALDEDAMWRIWEYDIGTKSLHKIVPKEESGPVLRKMLSPVLASLKNAGGKKIDYYCVPPVNMQPGKRYPVFMDLYSPNSFDDAVQFIANAGIYYVSPNRFGITDWRTVPEFENVLAVYEELLKNPNIDPQRVYLASVSKSTALASELVNAFPEKWRGVILQNPTAVPQIPANPTRYPRIFISIGDMELPEPRALVDNLMLDACRCLLPVHLDVQHSRHVHPKPQLKRCYLAMAKFILRDN